MHGKSFLDEKKTLEMSIPPLPKVGPQIMGYAWIPKTCHA